MGCQVCLTACACLLGVGLCPNVLHAALGQAILALGLQSPPPPFAKQAQKSSTRKPGVLFALFLLPAPDAADLQGDQRGYFLFLGPFVTSFETGASAAQRKGSKNKFRD